MSLGKFAAKLAKKDKSGYTKRVVEEAEVQRKVERMKKDELEKAAKSGTSDEKHYAKQELERRTGNKEMVKELKERQKKFPGLMSDKSLNNRIKANKRKLESSDDVRDSISNEYSRATGEDFRKGGMPKKYAIGGFSGRASGARKAAKAAQQRAMQPKQASIGGLRAQFEAQKRNELQQKLSPTKLGAPASGGSTTNKLTPSQLQTMQARDQQQAASAKPQPKEMYAASPLSTVSKAQKKQTSFVPGEENEMKLKQQAMAQRQSIQARMAKGGVVKKKPAVKKPVAKKPAPKKK